MSDAATLPVLGSKEFWQLYDDFCNPEELNDFVKKGESTHSLDMQMIMSAAHLAREIHNMSRPERGWMNHKAWLALRHAPIQNDKGDIVMHMRPGDVIVVEWAWDRDVIITHSPIPRNIVCGYLLSGQWDEMVGLFMPLFDNSTITHCITLRVAKNALEALTLAKEESVAWQWP